MIPWRQGHRLCFFFFQHSSLPHPPSNAFVTCRYPVASPRRTVALLGPNSVTPHARAPLSLLDCHRKPPLPKPYFASTTFTAVPPDPYSGNCTWLLLCADLQFVFEWNEAHVPVRSRMCAATLVGVGVLIKSPRGVVPYEVWRLFIAHTNKRACVCFQACAACRSSRKPTVPLPVVQCAFGR